MKGWRADEMSEEGEDDEVEKRDFCKSKGERKTTGWKK